MINGAPYLKRVTDRDVLEGLDDEFSFMLTTDAICIVESKYWGETFIFITWPADGGGWRCDWFEFDHDEMGSAADLLREIEAIKSSVAAP